MTDQNDTSRNNTDQNSTDQSSTDQMLADWAARLTADLGHPGLEVDIPAVLDLAGAAARAVVRPAAPLTTFLVGYAAGFAAATGAGSEAAVCSATETAFRACRDGDPA